MTKIKFAFDYLTIFMPVSLIEANHWEFKRLVDSEKILDCFEPCDKCWIFCKNYQISPNLFKFLHSSRQDFKSQYMIRVLPYFVYLSGSTQLSFRQCNDLPVEKFCKKQSRRGFKIDWVDEQQCLLIWTPFTTLKVPRDLSYNEKDQRLILCYCFEVSYVIPLAWQRLKFYWASF